MSKNFINKTKYTLIIAYSDKEIILYPGGTKEVEEGIWPWSERFTKFGLYVEFGEERKEVKTLTMRDPYAFTFNIFSDKGEAIYDNIPSGSDCAPSYTPPPERFDWNINIDDLYNQHEKEIAFRQQLQSSQEIAKLAADCESLSLTDNEELDELLSQQETEEEISFKEQLRNKMVYDYDFRIKRKQHSNFYDFYEGNHLITDCSHSEQVYQEVSFTDQEIIELEEACKGLSLTDEEITKLEKDCKSLSLTDQEIIELEEACKGLSLIDSEEKNIEILLAELKDNNPTYEAMLNDIEKKYNSFEDNYNKKWENESEKEIKNWVQKRRENKLGDNEADILEAIAVMNRANKLITGKRLRKIQILSILIFLQNQENLGRLCEIKTGEGKTLIIAMLSMIKVLQGYKVDIITSNSDLIKTGMKENGPLFDCLDISFSHNTLDTNSANINEHNKCYENDIVYGTISNFQFDYLKDFLAGNDVRKNREFKDTWAIVDEVDSMIIDNANNIAKVSSPFPGMEHLKYVYIKLWEYLNEHDEKEINDVKNNNIQQQIKDKFLKELSIQDLNGVSLIDIIPTHLHEYIQNPITIERWVKNATLAFRLYKNKVQFKIENNDKTLEPKIIPIDYKNTGASLNNTIWSYGLHQFIELAEGLHITNESLTSVQLSNYGYITKYKNNDKVQLFGLSGTLGSSDEQNLLSKLYGVETFNIPTYTIKNFDELKYKVVPDNQFINTIYQEVKDITNKGRAVLIICSTIKEAEDIENWLVDSGYQENKIKTYRGEKEASTPESDINCGEIIIATNIAGRGTNFTISKDLKKVGGLHVLVAFMPNNQRVQQQAYGRAGRRDEPGSAQLHIREQEKINYISEYKSQLKVQKEKLSDTAKISEIEKKIKEAEQQDILSIRNELEKFRIADIEETKVKQLIFMDEMNSNFLNMYTDCIKNFKEKQNNHQGISIYQQATETGERKLSPEDESLKQKLEGMSFEEQVKHLKSLPTPPTSPNSDEKYVDSILTDMVDDYYEYILDDLREHWAFWLDKKNFTEDKLKDKNGSELFSLAQKEFEEFKCNEKTKNIINGQISHNPYYSIARAEAFLEEGSEVSLINAERELENAKKISKDSKMLFSLHTKLFELTMEKNSIVKKKFVEAFGYILGMPKSTHDDNHKENASIYLRNAQTALRLEINYLKLLIDKIPESKYGFCELHLILRLIHLNIYENNISELIKTIETCDKNKELTIKLKIKTIDLLQALIPDKLRKTRNNKVVESLEENIRSLQLYEQKQEQIDLIKRGVTISESHELESIGMSTIYGVDTIHSLSDKFISTIRHKLIINSTAAVASIPFLPVTTTVLQTAITNVCFNILEVILELLKDSNEASNANIWGDLLSLGLSVLCIPRLPNLSYIKFINNSVKCNKMLINAYRVNNYLLPSIMLTLIGKNIAERTLKLPVIKKQINEELEKEAKKRYETEKPSEEPGMASPSTNPSDVQFEPSTYTPEVDEKIPTDQAGKNKSSSSSSSNNSKSNSKNQPSRKLIPEQAVQIQDNNRARPTTKEQEEMINALDAWNFCDRKKKINLIGNSTKGFRLEFEEDKQSIEIQNNNPGAGSKTTVGNVHWVTNNSDSLQQFLDKEGPYQQYGKNQNPKVMERWQRINNNVREALKIALGKNIKFYINLEDFNQAELQFKQKLEKITKNIITEIINGGREINLNSNSIISDLKYWMDYNSEVLMQFLRLRLASSLSFESLEQVVVINPLLLHKSTSATNCVNNLLEEAVKRRYLNCRDKYILIPISCGINSFLYHWVGLVLKINHGLLEICYIDSTNQEMDVELKSIILNELSKISNNYTYKQMLVENQKDYNCGPELIENLMYYLTNSRATQESAVYLHSLLYENTLLDQSASELEIQKNIKFIDLLSKQVPVDEIYFCQGLPVISKNLLFSQQYGDSLQSAYLEEPEMSEKKGLLLSHKPLL